ncbi:hypothetical protein KPH14_009964 [Odynerus spinipes]|uniref:Small ribosomal subunit protein mS31 n=1 Tax=Odynerus spinipes TaxID=1348599 RepID=A0AAD9RSY8_9HYME|nr:hypothetical protein KPH14_009964 [Odynerus spinipes]
MLATSKISIGITLRVAIPVQRLCTSIKMYSTSSGSSSDSSDSDSDAECLQKNSNTNIMDVALPLRETTKKQKVQTEKNLSYEAQLTKAAENVTNVLSGDKEKIKSELLDRLSHGQRERLRMQKEYNLKQYNKLVTNTAAERTSAFIRKERSRHDTESWTSRKSVIHELSAQQQKENQKHTMGNQVEQPSIIQELLAQKGKENQKYTMRNQHQHQVEQPSIIHQLSAQKGNENQKSTMRNQHEHQVEQPSIIRQLSAQKGNENQKSTMRNQHEHQVEQPSIIHQLSAQKENENQKYTMRNQHEHQVEQPSIIHQLSAQKGNENNYIIFSDIKEPTTDIPELSTWKLLEQRQLALLSNHAPENIFQEMIQWTESGKLWTFPIDNEYGMEEEHNIHFSEHVFLERHLKDWCPKRGPVRHFMELVCIGLSKNPYMTVDEKIGHITWYKEYFKGKEELLKELGAIDAPSNVKEQIQT